MPKRYISCSEYLLNLKDVFLEKWSISLKLSSLPTKIGWRFLPSAVLPYYELVWVEAQVSGKYTFLNFELLMINCKCFPTLKLYRTWSPISAWMVSCRAKRLKSGFQNLYLRTRWGPPILFMISKVIIIIFTLSKESNRFVIKILYYS